MFACPPVVGLVANKHSGARLSEGVDKGDADAIKVRRQRKCATTAKLDRRRAERRHDPANPGFAPW